MMTPGKSLPPPDKEEIRQAIRVIRKVCEHYNNCQICQLRTSDNHCGMFYYSSGERLVSPRDYKIESDLPERIFFD